MKVSAIYIAKNEANNIARSLESVKDAVDELILVDTGSTDNTVEIFRSFGGKVYHQAWKNDFSAPRNLALSKATGEWLILLDADEYFSPETAGNIRKIISDAKKDVLMVNIVNIDAETNDVNDYFYNVRIVRNQEGLYYSGRIHEHICLRDRVIDSIEKIPADKLTIIHTGYSSKNIVKKAERNLTILHQEIKEGRDEKELYTYLAECYDGINDKKNMLKYAKLDIELGRRPVTYGTRSYRKVIKYYTEINDWENKFIYVKRAVQDFPELPEFHAELGLCFIQFFEFIKAENELLTAINLYQNYNGLEPTLLGDNEIELIHKQIAQIHEIANKEKNIKISACLICKNEEKNIGRWLENVKKFADEIIIADTGSQDRTKEILQQNNINYYNYNWQNDFAAAKNFVIEHTKSDWIVFTDCDEFFYEPQRVRGLIAKYGSGRDAFMLPLVNVDEDKNNIESSRFNAIRIFRNSKELRYFGKVHEVLCNTATPGDSGSLKVVTADSRNLIRHTGYSSNIIKEKIRRDMSILQNEIEVNGLQDRHHRPLADLYMGMGDYKKALKYALLALESPMQAKGMAGDMYWLIAECLGELDYSLEEQEKLLQQAMLVCEKSPDFYALMGLHYFKYPECKKITEAESFLLLAVEKAKNTIMAEQNNTSSIHFFSIENSVYTALGYCKLWQGKIYESREYFKKALSLNKWYDTALLGIVDSYDNCSKQELVQYLSKLYDYENNPSNKQILIKIFRENGVIEMAKVLINDEKLNNIWPEGSNSDIIHNKALEAINYLQVLVVSMLGADIDITETTTKKQLELLPGDLKYIVFAYHGIDKENSLHKIKMDDYKAMLPAVLSHHNNEIREKYVSIAEYFSSEDKVTIADIVRQKEMWNEALAIYQQIPADSTAVDANFWLGAGVCLFHIGNREAAVECMKKALKTAVGDVAGEAESYLAWCGEEEK